MATPYDPASFFANLMKSVQEQMQNVVDGAAVPGGSSPDVPDPAAQMAAATRQFAELSQQYMANLGRMAGIGGVPQMSAQMAAVTRQLTDLQQQYVESLSKLTALPAGMPDASAQMAEAGRQFASLQQRYLASLGQVTGGPAPSPDASAQLASVTRHLASLQQQYLSAMQDMASAWTAGASAAQPPAIDDKRFASDAWSSDPRFDAVRRTYLAYSDFIDKTIEAAPIDERQKGQLRFAGRQFVDAMSPANFFVTNPEAIALAMETGGQSVSEGMKLFFQDFARGRITMTDEQAFAVGRNLAVTPGAVVYENDIMQLVQYQATSQEVHARPLVIVPPCINKFYILDLQPENSFVAHAVAQGHTVFVVSWRNVGEDQGRRTWDDYLRMGPLQAIDVALDITGADQANALGFCIGGTLLGSAAAVMTTNDDHRIASLTLLTSMLDFSDTGEIGLLVDEKSVEAREAAIGNGGLLRGEELAFVFSSLRANDLIWPYVVSSYLKGKGPPAFDLLYWNSDATNLPGPMFCWYVRHTYLQNDLRVPGRTVQCDVPVDLGDIDCPAYVYASREDHIVPWKTAYESTRILGGDNRFVLGASGHIAGVINPPAKQKRNYWAGGPQGSDPDTWLMGAEKIPGSWWPDWTAWLARNAGDKVAAPKSPGNARHRVIEPAPGRYVKEKAR